MQREVSASSYLPLILTWINGCLLSSSSPQVSSVFIIECIIIIIIIIRGDQEDHFCYNTFSTIFPLFVIIHPLQLNKGVIQVE